ncbi:MAG: D-alanyl-D-alanine carboxypeptidase family protein [Peptococcia bacterium]|jgi:D-alanyl-D-alanine carboxypeptidase (penicillin-binding protein 5/6)
MRKLLNTLKFLVMIVVIVFALIIVGNKVGVIDFNLMEIDVTDYASKYICVLNRETKKVEYKRNFKIKAYPASLTKMMTAIVALEKIDNLSETAPVDIDTYKEMVAKNASMAGFYGRERVTYRDLLYGTILSSGGEAANSLAVNVAGSVEEFVRLMNEKAAVLGLKGTHFTNPEGLHDNEQYTTAYDLACLLDYALDNGHFKAIFTSKTFKTTPTLDHPQGIVLKSTVLSKLEDVNQEGFQIIGGKSGTTSEAGECWATLVLKDGREYICIVMGVPLKDIHNPDNAQIEDSIKLLERIK